MGPGFESPKVHQNENIEYLFNVFVYRGIAQLVESRSPKPLVLGSSPSAPAKITERMFPLRYFLSTSVWILLAGVEGLEPSQTVLETGVLPLTPYPYIKFKSGGTLKKTNNAYLVERQGLEPRTNRL